MLNALNKRSYLEQSRFHAKVAYSWEKSLFVHILNYLLTTPIAYWCVCSFELKTPQYNKYQGEIFFKKVLNTLDLPSSLSLVHHMELLELRIISRAVPLLILWKDLGKKTSYFLLKAGKNRLGFISPCRVLLNK